MIRRLLRLWKPQGEEAKHLLRGRLGEEAAEGLLKVNGLKLLTRNYRSDHGEIDLICRDGDCLVFIEVKTRSSEKWGSPASAVDRKKQKRISKTAVAYLQKLGNPELKFRFDIVEVLVDGNEIENIRHLVNAFPLSAPLRYR